VVWAASEGQRAALAARFEAIFPHLDERQRRLLTAEARSIGHGGIRPLARAGGVREATVSLGANELGSGEAPLGRVRRTGGGRKRTVDLDLGLRPALLAQVEPDVRGDPAHGVDALAGRVVEHPAEGALPGEDRTSPG